MVLSARSTRNVLRADTLPRSTNSVTYLRKRSPAVSSATRLEVKVPPPATHAMLITMKSSQFHGSRRNVKGPRQKPLDTTLTAASKV